MDIQAPDLRIVTTTSIHPHEVTDSQRGGPLVESIKQDGFLRNPIIVTELTDTDYMLLDGTNRHNAFSELGFEHTLVQVVPYQHPHVELSTWNHVLAESQKETITKTITSIPGLATNIIDKIDRSTTYPKLATKELSAYLLFSDNSGITVQPTSTKPSLEDHAQVLNKLVSTYMNIGRLNRTNINDLASLQQLYPDLETVVYFLEFSPADVTHLVQQDTYAPAGVTRHIIHGRALNVNYPLAKLAEEKNTEAKNHDLTQWLQEKYARREVRVYQEAVYMFDE